MPSELSEREEALLEQIEHTNCSCVTCELWRKSVKQAYLAGKQASKWILAPMFGVRAR